MVKWFLGSGGFRSRLRHGAAPQDQVEVTGGAGWAGSAWLRRMSPDGSAELMGLPERRGDGSGVDYGERRRQWLSVRARGEPEEGEEHGESEGGIEGDVGVGVAPLDASRASAEAGGGRHVAAGAATRSSSS